MQVSGAARAASLRLGCLRGKRGLQLGDVLLCTGSCIPFLIFLQLFDKANKHHFFHSLALFGVPHCRKPLWVIFTSCLTLTKPHPLLSVPFSY